MKRHPALIPFSHDHQNTLARALRLRRADALEPAERRDELDQFLEFARDRVLPHFAAEERAMLRVRDIRRTDEIDAGHRRMLDEHADLRARIDELDQVDGDPDAALLQDTGTMLTQHVRFEERDLFELLQRELGDALTGACAADVPVD